MVQIPKGRLQSLELVFKAASEFYTAYYNSSVRMENVAPGNKLAMALQLERQIDALDEQVRVLENAMKQDWGIEYE